MSVSNFEKYSDEHGPLLAEIIKFNHCKTVVEIGVAAGTTTYYLCKYASKVYGFDVWTKHGLQDQFVAFGTKKGVNDYLIGKGVTNFELYQVDSKSSNFDTILDTLPPIDFALIDGCHSYDGIRNDFYKVLPKLSPEGIIVFHDTVRIDGCRQMMIELRINHGNAFDVMDFPFGNGKRRVGITVFKRKHMMDLPIDESCGSSNTYDEIYEKERQYYGTC